MLYRLAFIRTALEEFFDHIELVDVLDSSDSENLKLLSRPDLGVTFTKLHCWRLTQYSKCVFMDADTLVCYFDYQYFYSFCSSTVSSFLQMRLFLPFLLICEYRVILLNKTSCN